MAFLDQSGLGTFLSNIKDKFVLQTKYKSDQSTIVSNIQALNNLFDNDGNAKKANSALGADVALCSVSDNLGNTISSTYITDLNFVENGGVILNLGDESTKDLTNYIARYNRFGFIKPPYTSTNAARLTTSAASNTNTPTIAEKTTTTGRYYGIEADKNGYLYVNVPWISYNFSNNNPTLSWGASSTIGSVGGVDLTLKMPANPNTHYETKLFATSSTGTAHAATTNGNTYLRLFDNSTARQSIKISGSGSTTVTSDASGNITISSTGGNYSLPSATATTLGGVKIGSNISVSSGIISLNSTNITDALGYTPLSLAGGTMTGTIITPGDDSAVIRPSKNNYDTIGSDKYYFYKMYSTNYYLGTGTADMASGTLKIKTINAPTSSEGSAYGAGNDGQFLKSNGTTVYWGSISYGDSATALGTSSAGSATTVSRSDHVHALPALTSCTGTLTVAKGGTGSTSKSGARTNLGISSGTSLNNAPSNPSAGDIFFLY